MITADQRIPSDFIVIATDKEDGTCFIETGSLDGEKNLKLKKAHDKIGQYYVQGIPKESYLDNPDQDALKKLKTPATCQTGARSDKLYEFTGNLRVDERNWPDKAGGGKEDKKLAISHQQFLLSGAVLKNTQYAIGIVVFTGFDTRMMMNSKTGG